MSGEGKERLYAILNISLLLGASFSLVAFSSIKDQYASEIEFPEREEALVYDPSVHHFDLSDVWKIVQRFVTNEPPTTKGEGVIRDPPPDRVLEPPPPVRTVPGTPVRKPHHDRRTPGEYEPAPDFVGQDPPPKESDNDSLSTSVNHPEKDQTGTNDDEARERNVVRMFWLSKLSDIEPNVMDGCGLLPGRDEFVRITFLGPPQIAPQTLTDEAQKRGVRWKVRTKLDIKIYARYQNGAWEDHIYPEDHPFQAYLEEDSEGNLTAYYFHPESSALLKDLRACRCRLTPPIDPILVPPR